MFMRGGWSSFAKRAGVGTLKLALRAVSRKELTCSTNNTQPRFDPPKSEWQDSLNQINEMGKCIRGNTAF